MIPIILVGKYLSIKLDSSGTPKLLDTNVRSRKKISIMAIKYTKLENRLKNNTTATTNSNNTIKSQYIILPSSF